MLARSISMTGAIALASLAMGRGAPSYDVYAIRYATIPNFRVSNLIQGADTSRRLDIAMMVWLLKGSDGRNVVVDAGFHRADFVTRWKPTNFVAPSEALERAGVKADDVTDVIISHIHWDHLDGIDLFQRRRSGSSEGNFSITLIRRARYTIARSTPAMPKFSRTSLGKAG